MLSIDTVHRFPVIRRHLDDLLRTASDAELMMPTVCPGWTVKDVALHLLGVNVANISRRRDGFSDAFQAFVPVTADLDRHSDLVAALSDWNRSWVVATRRISTLLLRTLLDSTGAELEAVYRAMDHQAIGDPVGWAGPEPAPVWFDIAREYTEQWVHQAQMRDALNLPLLDNRDLFAPVLDTFMRALPYALHDTDASADTSVRVDITGDAGGRWLVVRIADRWEWREAGDAVPSAHMAIDQDIAWRLFTKGISPEEAQPHIQVTGDDRFTDAVQRMVTIIA